MIRRAADHDLAPLAALDATLFDADAWSEAQLREEVAGLDRYATVLTDDGNDDIVGYAITLVRGDVADLHRIGVAVPRRREGLARLLLDDATAYAKEQRADRMLLEVSASNVGAMALYADAGFTEIARRPRYYRDGSDAVVLRRSLARGCGGG